MAIKYKKDLTQCKAWRNVPVPFWDGHYYRVFLWNNLDALRANVIADDGKVEDECKGMATHAHYVQVLPDSGCAYTRAPRYTGEIHLLAGQWDEEIVAHEVFHATVNVCKLLRITPEQAIEYEERAAYIQGIMTYDIYHWLWDIDTPKEDVARWWMRMMFAPVVEMIKAFRVWMRSA